MEVLRDLFLEIGLRFFHDVFECVACTGPGLPRHAPPEKIAWGTGAWIGRVLARNPRGSMAVPKKRTPAEADRLRVDLDFHDPT